MMDTLVNAVLISLLFTAFSTESDQAHSSLNYLTLNRPGTVQVPRLNAPFAPIQGPPGGDGVPLIPPPLPPFRLDDRVRPVSVTCHPSAMEVRIESDLFQTGFPVKPEDLSLGSGGPGCGVGAATPRRFVILVPLTGCGTHYRVTENALVYSNVLLYSPAVTPDGLIRSEEISVPVECRYGRRFGVDSDLVIPTWIPRRSVSSSRQSLKFSLHIMSRDWTGGRVSSEYFLGDLINLEVSVFTSQRDLKVYVERCVATTTPDMTSHPAYTLIEDGCFTDGRQEGSRSRFLPRMHHNKLQLELDAFIFDQVSSSRIYISCVVRAGLLNRACSFIDNRWTSADGDDGVCEGCSKDLNEVNPDLPATQDRDGSVKPLDPLSHITQLPASANSWIDTEAALNKVDEPLDKGDWSREASVGPLSLAAWKDEWEMDAPPIIRNGNASPRYIKANETGAPETLPEPDVAEMFSRTEPGLLDHILKPPVMRDIMLPPETTDAGTDWVDAEDLVDLGYPVDEESLHTTPYPTHQESITEGAALNSFPVYTLRPQSDPAGVWYDEHHGYS